MNPVRVLFIALGFVCLALGAIGVVLPVLPTTPFLLLASFFFAKGSKRFNSWFTNTSLYKNHLDSFVTDRAMTRKTKVRLCAFASTMLVIAFVAAPVIWVRALIVAVIAFKYYYFICRIRTITPEEESAQLAAEAKRIVAHPQRS